MSSSTSGLVVSSSSSSSNSFTSSGVNTITLTHKKLPKLKQDLATTPLYCEPKDFSSTSSTISNAVTDPEYAVPDVALGHHHLHNHNQSSARLNNNNNNNIGNGGSSGGNGGGHLNSNLNMFGAGFTRIFMGGQTLGGGGGSGKHGNGNNKTTAPIPVNAATLHGSFAHLNGNNTSNVAYSGKQQQQQQFPVYLSDAQLKNGGGGSSYSVNLNSKINGYVNPLPVTAAAGRQYYASTDLMMVRSPKTAKNANAGEQNAAANGMTSNTIYK